VSSTDNVTTPDANSYKDSTKVLVHATNPSTVDSAADISSMDANGFTLLWSGSDAGSTRQFVWLAFGNTPLTQSVSDSATPTDALVKAPILREAEAPALSDALVKAPSPRLSETAALADVFAKTASFYRPQDDSAGLSDTSSLAAALSFTETGALIDALAKSAGIHFADTASPSEAFLKSLGLLEQETLSLSDAVRDALALALVDLVALSDAHTQSAGFTRTFSDAASLGEVLTLRPALRLAESLAVADASLRGLGIEIADSEAVLDALTKVWTATLSLSEAIALTETFSRVPTGPHKSLFSVSGDGFARAGLRSR
jgi:hypothetical protein